MSEEGLLDLAYSGGETSSNNYNPRFEDDLLTYPTGGLVNRHGRPAPRPQPTSTGFTPQQQQDMRYRAEQTHNWAQLAAQSNAGPGGDDVWTGNHAPLTLTGFEWRKALFIAVAGGLIAVTAYSMLIDKKSIFSFGTVSAE